MSVGARFHLPGRGSRRRGPWSQLNIHKEIIINTKYIMHSLMLLCQYPRCLVRGLRCPAKDKISD